MNKLQEPLNQEERYLHGINVRLNVLIEMFSSFLDVYADEKEVSTSNNEVVIEEEEKEETTIKVEKDIKKGTNSKKYYSYLTKKDIARILDEYDVEYNTTMLKSELIDLVRETI